MIDNIILRFSPHNDTTVTGSRIITGDYYTVTLQWKRLQGPDSKKEFLGTTKPTREIKIRMLEEIDASDTYS